jgi:hypothetical protein
MSPLSSDPGARAAQLANLRRGETRPIGKGRPPTHGAYAVIAERDLNGKVAELYAAIGQDLPVREADGGVPAADAIPLRMLAEALIRRERVRDTEVRHGIEAPDGKVRGVVEYGLRLDGHVLRLAEQLGLTPRSRAALGLDLARAQGAAERLLADDLAASRAAWERHDNRTEGA